MSYTAQSKNATSYNTTNKLATSFVAKSKAATTFQSIKQVTYLLKEDAFFLLLEDGYKIILNKLGEAIYTNKQKLSTSYSAQAKI